MVFVFISYFKFFWLLSALGICSMFCSYMFGMFLLFYLCFLWVWVFIFWLGLCFVLSSVVSYLIICMFLVVDLFFYWVNIFCFGLSAR